MIITRSRTSPRPRADPQIGGLTFLPDGRLAACFHRGEVYTYEPKTKT